MKWADLTKNQRIVAVAGAAVLLLVVVVGAYALGRAGNEDRRLALESTTTPEATTTVGPPAAAEIPPATPTESAPPGDAGATGGSAPVPEASDEGRVFGQLKGIRDESGGAWADLWIDVDTAVFLTGDPALAWLTEVADPSYYNAYYWYARNDTVNIASYRVLASDQPAVWMYTWPTVPAPGFYGPGMGKQVTNFGIFYDQIYMNEDAAQFLNRYYWFTVVDGHVTVIEEQPRDSYYEP